MANNSGSPLRTASFVSLRVDTGHGLGDLDCIGVDEGATEGSSESAVACSVASVSSGEHQEMTKEPKIEVFDAMSLTGCGGLAAVFYSVAFCMRDAGIYTPLVMLVSYFVIYLLKTFFIDLLTALPVNGGSYNALTVLNGASAAIFMAGIHIAVYISTGATSAKYAILLLQNFFGYPSWMAAGPFTVTLIVVVAMVSCLGVQPTAKLTFFTMTFHGLAMFTFFIASGIAAIQGHDADGTEGGFNNDTGDSIFRYNVENSGVGFGGIYHGFVATFVLVSGVHEAAEQPEHLVFAFNAKKVVSRLFLLVGLSTLMTAVLAIYLIKVDEVEECFYNGTMLTLMGRRTGRWLEKLMGFDGVLILSAGVASSFSSFVTLVARMATDGKMPSLLGTTNILGSRHYAILLYTLFVTAIFVVLEVVEHPHTPLPLLLLSMASMILGYVLSEIALKRLAHELQLPRTNNPPSWPSIYIVLAGSLVAMSGALQRSPITSGILILCIVTSSMLLSLATLYSAGKLTTCFRPLKWATVSKAEAMHHTQLSRRRDTILTFQPVVPNPHDEGSECSTSRAPTPKWSPPPSPIENV